MFRDLRIGTGFDELARAIRELSERHSPAPLILIDGFSGMLWTAFSVSLQEEMTECGWDGEFRSTDELFLPPERVEDLLAPTLTDDPVFGWLFRGHLDELWDRVAVQRMKSRIEERTGPVVVCGAGASLLDRGGVRVYVDVPKDVVQRRAARGEIVNAGAAGPSSSGEMYKRFYFVDWPMLNRIKRAEMARADIVIDGSEPDKLRFVSGEQLRTTLTRLSTQPFRVRPWFAPGPWGGKWMKERFGLPPEEPNYAWSFELIAPENGVVLSDGRERFECSFDCLLWRETDAVLGTAVAARYGSYFPIRFDYLDTMGGTNLSCQVHPRTDYVREEFGEPFTQDETYYIVTCQEDARIFLGLREDADVDAFKSAATNARDHGVPFDISTYVNSEPAHPHDLFLIPSGTVHCSGADNLVLEISATPYIFTFKIYDYLRADLHGNLRQVHLDHAFANLDTGRRTEWVRQHLIARPSVVRQGHGWSEHRLTDTDLLFFAIHRLEFDHAIDDCTNGTFLAINMVGGERCEVRSERGDVLELRFAESAVIPAAAGRVTFTNTGNHRCRIAKAFVKT